MLNSAFITNCKFVKPLPSNCGCYLLFRFEPIIGSNRKDFVNDVINGLRPYVNSVEPLFDSEMINSFAVSYDSGKVPEIFRWWNGEKWKVESVKLGHWLESLIRNDELKVLTEGRK